MPSLHFSKLAARGFLHLQLFPASVSDLPELQHPSPTPATLLPSAYLELHSPVAAAPDILHTLALPVAFVPSSILHAIAMDDTERRTAKRSRFDQTEPEPRRSRFDRRSRSPAARKSDSTRDRSPLNRGADSATPETKKNPVDAAAAAGWSNPYHMSLIARARVLTSHHSRRRRQDQRTTAGKKRHPACRRATHQVFL